MAGPDQTPRLTLLLNQLGDGEASVEEELIGLIYDDLRTLAHARLGSGGNRHTLQPTALVHEAWMRVRRQDDLRFDRRQQFFTLASKAMRSVLMDHARAAAAQKRGGGRPKMTLGDVESPEEPSVDLLALDAALKKLETMDSTMLQIVEMRFFGGLNHGEIAEALHVSRRTVERHWRFARAWLHSNLSDAE